MFNGYGISTGVYERSLYGVEPSSLKQKNILYTVSIKRKNNDTNQMRLKTFKKLYMYYEDRKEGKETNFFDN